VNLSGWDRLPAARLASDGTRSRAFRNLDCHTFQEAAAFVHGLPYGRNTDRADFDAVLREHRGTCSTKHALLAALAEEEDLPIRLMVGLYAMGEANTPGVGEALRRHGFDQVPEAHCYLEFDGVRVDITHANRPLSAEPIRIEHEHPIRPVDIGRAKIELHQAYIRAWLASPAAPQRSFDEVWRAREAAIAALAGG
jgi:hypothetical protein